MLNNKTIIRKILLLLYIFLFTSCLSLKDDMINIHEIPKDMEENNLKREKLGLIQVKAEWYAVTNKYPEKIITEKDPEAYQIVWKIIDNKVIIGTPGKIDVSKLEYRDINGSILYEEDSYYSGKIYKDLDPDNDFLNEKFNVFYEYTTNSFSISYAGEDKEIGYLFNRFSPDSWSDERAKITNSGQLCFIKTSDPEVTKYLVNEIKKRWGITIN